MLSQTKIFKYITQFFYTSIFRVVIMYINAPYNNLIAQFSNITEKSSRKSLKSLFWTLEAYKYS